MCSNCKDAYERCKKLAELQAIEENEIYVVIKYSHSGSFNIMTKEYAIINKMNVVYETI